MTFNYVAIGKRIRAIRQRRGLTQNDLSERIGRSPSYLSYIETGNKNMSLDTFVALANALGVSSDELLADSLENTLKLSSHEFTAMLADCNEYERRVLKEVLSATKFSLRNNRFYLRGRL